MAEPVYLAKFGSATGEFYSAALAWPAPTGALLPAAWWRVLKAVTDVDITLRIAARNGPMLVLMLTADRADSLHALIAQLESAAPVIGLRQAHDADAFDTLAELGIAPPQLRAHHAGYHRDGQPLACDFRLYAAWVGQGLADGVGYQLCLRPRRDGAEQERRVRKYLAWLELEQPFTPPVRELQQILARRLLAPGWLADEYLLFADAAQRDTWLERLRGHFAETTGRIGFPEAPLEAGDYSDRLATGYHASREGGAEAVVPVEAADTFTEDEVTWLVQQDLGLLASGRSGRVPEVFVSYASPDFAQADAARQSLEGGGRRCWIAPRDINIGGLPYTEAITEAMQAVRAVVVLLSPSANISVHIPRELDMALERKLPIIPLRLADVTPQGQLEYLLRTCQWLDLFGRDHDDAMRELEQRLAALGI